MSTTPIEVPAVTDAIKEMQIKQMLTGLRMMPSMLPRLEKMTDEITQEVVRRYKAKP